jgi:hypothetical protein
MIQLTPLEETVAGKELIQIGVQRGRKEGEQQSKKKWLTKGEIIGEIRMAQRMLKLPVSTQKDLIKKGMTTLRKMLQYLKAEEAEAHGEKLEVIGKITLAQQILKRPVSPKEDLMENSLEDLNALFEDLQAELAKLN